VGIIKRYVKRSFERYQNRKEYNSLIRFIDKEIEKSAHELPQLTPAQVQEIRAFWEKYGFKDIPLQWHRFYYGKTGQIRPDFIPAPLFFQNIKPAMNNVSFAAVWSDKSYLDFFLPGILTAQCVLRNVEGRWLDEGFHLLEKQKAEEILQQYDSLVIKPAIDTNTGKGVALLHSPFSIDEMLASHHKNFVVQIPLRQHPEMGKLNASSVNTIRVNSVLLETQAHVMSSFVKVGQAGEFADNSGHDRFFIGIQDNGTFMEYAIDHDFNIYKTIPSGFDFAGKSVPFYEKVCRVVETAHQRIAHFGFAFWDVCVREDGEPVIVEMNLKKPASMVPQVACGPFFGKYTEQIMESIIVKHK